jgi:predicted ATPase
MTKLDRINIENFKSLKNLNIELKPLNVFIGANGAGKSNFVGVFRFLNHLVDGNLQNHVAASGGADKIVYFGRKVTEKMSIKLSFKNGVNGYECVLAAGAEDNFYFEEETVWFHDKQRYDRPYNDFLGSGHLESRLSKSGSSVTRRVALYVLNHLRSWKLYHFHDTSDSARVKQTGDLEDNRILEPDARNLAAFLYRLQQRHENHFENIQDAVSLVAPFFDRFNLQPSSLNPDKIRLEWKEKESDSYFNGTVLSDGTLRFICLATLLLQPTLPSVILLDEPELGLHPYAMTVISDLLQSASKKSQVIVATQSVTLVNQFAPEDIVVVEREKGESIFRRLDQEDMSDWLEDYGLGDLWEKNIFGGRP